MSPNSADKLIGVVPTPSPLARGAPPTMEEMIAMERRKVAYGKKFSLELAPVTPSVRFNLIHQQDTSLDAALSNGKLLQIFWQQDGISWGMSESLHVRINMVQGC